LDDTNRPREHIATRNRKSLWAHQKRIKIPFFFCLFAVRHELALQLGHHVELCRRV
jgi:hypothetical protein